MTEQVRWRDAVGAAERLTDGDRRTLRLLTHLPLLWEGAIERLDGARAGAPVYRRLARLRAMGLVDEIHLAFRVGRNPGLLYLTDLGIATIAVDRQVDAAYLARRARLRGPDLLARLPGLPHLLAAYQLLVAVAGVRTGRARLIAWEQPWRGRLRRPTRKAPISIELPAYAALTWAEQAAELVLVPDLATFPLRAYRPAIGHLQALSRVSGSTLPTLIVATTDTRRSAWVRLLDDVARSRGSAPLVVHLATWRDLLVDCRALSDAASATRPASTLGIRDPRLRPLGERQPGSRIPRPVGTVFQRGSSDGGTASLVLEVKPVERLLLDLVGRHPFLPADSLADVLGWDVRRVRERRARLIRLGLMRLLRVDERHWSTPDDLTELTEAGLEIVAGQQGLSLARAVHFNGLAGGGPEHPTGIRRLLLRDLAHTLGADAHFVGLFRRYGAMPGAGSDAILEWRSTSACSRRRVRPDGYGMVRHHGELHGFFLEYDRGTMSARDYAEKWAGFYDYRDSRAFEQDYDGFPTILVVTTDSKSEERIARSARAASVGRALVLPLLLTCEWRITGDPTNPDGLFGPIWREPHDAYAARRRWPPGASRV
ncbi:MAG: replication-relaxation family protein [Chloroflexi bacterium]|nr:replication-relaxation family protein [Chloroflexota bacterium]